MRKDEVALIVTLFVGAALIGARTATAQGSLAEAAPSLELRALWQAPAASLFFDRGMPR
jgi:hypothetical protein